MNRRKFLKAVGGIVGFPYVVRAAALGLEGKTAASNRITVGCIGNGPQGNDDMRNLLSQDDCRVVAVCDVWKRARDAAKAIVDKRYEDNGCAVNSDFRELLARGDIDAVQIATPDHWHTIIGIEAAKAGKDMYIEKPMGHSIEENQILRDAVRRYKAVFQFGTQQRSDVNFRTACEAVANGRIGKLQTINVWAPASVAGGTLAPAPVPEGLDYEMWTGPAQWMPYAEHRCDGTPNVKHWWYNSNYAMGFIAGWGIHPIDIAMWGGGKLVEGPIEIEGSGEFPKDGACDTAVKWKVAMKFGSGVVMNFVSTPAPEEWRRKYVKTKTTTHGTVFEGSDGWRLLTGWGFMHRSRRC